MPVAKSAPPSGRSHGTAGGALQASVLHCLACAHKSQSMGARLATHVSALLCVDVVGSDEVVAQLHKHFHFCRRQFPFKHAWAATINKSQGATLDHYAIYCDRHLFGHGQAYTALSRGRSQETCKVYVCCEDSPPDSLTTSSGTRGSAESNERIGENDPSANLAAFRRQASYRAA